MHQLAEGRAFLRSFSSDLSRPGHQIEAPRCASQSEKRSDKLPQIDDVSEICCAHQGAAQAPHVNRHIIFGSQDYLWSAIVPALYVGIHSLFVFARAPKINQLDCTPFWVSEKNIFWFEVSMNNSKWMEMFYGRNKFSSIELSTVNVLSKTFCG